MYDRFERSTGNGAAQSPVPVVQYFGGKSKVAPLVWQAFGDVQNYCEPFAGSLAVLLGRPDFNPEHPPLETVNDLDGMICNFWRAISADPEQVAQYADWPVNENDLHARHIWLVNRKPEMQVQLEGDPEWYDAKAAGWWVWGISAWIGGGWCSGKGPWQSVEGKLVNVKEGGVNRQLPHLGTAGQGVNVGVEHKRPHLMTPGKGVHKKRPLLGATYGDGVGVHKTSAHLLDWFTDLQTRLRRVRVCCGDWNRVCGPSVTVTHGMTGVFLDPPYSHSERDSTLYACDHDVMADVVQWCIQNGDNPLLRIVLCGYDDVQMPDTWRVIQWKTAGGYGSHGNGRGVENKIRERLWLSPACLTEHQRELFP